PAPYRAAARVEFAGRVASGRDFAHGHVSADSDGSRLARNSAGAIVSGRRSVAELTEIVSTPAPHAAVVSPDAVVLAPGHELDDAGPERSDAHRRGFRTRRDSPVRIARRNGHAELCEPIVSPALD